MVVEIWLKPMSASAMERTGEALAASFPTWEEMEAKTAGSHKLEPYPSMGTGWKRLARMSDARDPSSWIVVGERAD